MDGIDRRRYRKVFVRLWTDPRFWQLRFQERVVVLYLLTGPPTNRCGLYRLTIEQLAGDLRLARPAAQRSLEIALATFNWRYDSKAMVVWIPGWWDYNRPPNRSALTGALRDVAEVPANVHTAAFNAHIDDLRARLTGAAVTLPSRPPLGRVSDTRRGGVPHQEQEQDREEEQEQEEDQEPPPIAPRRDGNSEVLGAGGQGDPESQWDGFSRFWDAYPKKKGPWEAAWREWCRLAPDTTLVKRILAAVAVQKQQGAFDDDQFAPFPRNWLAGQRWRDGEGDDEIESLMKEAMASLAGPLSVPSEDRGRR